jgi:antitoxin component YwqK of YwqJK toxin-antitoxin module
MRSLISKNRLDRSGRKQGYWESYYSDGVLQSKGLYKNDERHGIWEYYYSDGDLIKTKIYKNNNLIEINENNDN